MKKEAITVYLKISQNIGVENRKVTLGDVASITCNEYGVASHLKQKTVYVFDETKKKQTKIFSILKIIELIHEEYPEAEIENEGETDFIIEYVQKGKKEKIPAWIKTVGVCIVVFFGAAFTIMSFNNDVAINELFKKFYYQVMGVPSNGMTELELFYCIGLATGITVFFNHFGKKKLSEDPTPIQVQMRKFEKDVNTTCIENAARKGEVEDVD